MTWEKNGGQLPDNCEVHELPSVNGLTNYALKLYNVQRHHEGVYECSSAKLDGLIKGDFSMILVYPGFEEILTG